MTDFKYNKLEGDLLKKGILIYFVWTLMIFLLYVPKVIAVGEKVVFEMQDPIGDDCGPGNYTYPTNIAFSPGKSHYDLVNFKVSEDDEHVFFAIFWS